MPKTDKVARVWKSLVGRRRALIETFYERLFQRYPHYRDLFPPSMDKQMEKMVDMMRAVARFADDIPMVRPYLLRVAQAHRNLNLEQQDLENFRNVLLESIAEFCPDEVWDDETEALFNRAFDDTIIPIFKEGMDLYRVHVSEK